MSDRLQCRCGGQITAGRGWRCTACGFELPQFSVADVRDPVRFIEGQFLIRDEVTGMPRLIRLEPFQKALLRDVYPPTLSGEARARNALISQPKKVGKSTFLAALALYHAVRKAHSEVYVLATTREQARAVMFDKVRYAVEAHPYWSKHGRERGSTIDFATLGSMVRVVPNNWRAIEGFNPDAVFVDELHAFTVTGDRRAFDALVIPPTKTGVRWLTSYAGFEGESVLLEQYWALGMAGEIQNSELPIRYNAEASLWSFIDQGEKAWRMPWMQGEGWEAYLAGLQADPSPTAFLRFARNEWASSEQRFIEPEKWDALEVGECALGKAGEERRAFVLAADAATKRDCTALVGATYDEDLGRVEIIYSKIWTPEGGGFDLRVLGREVVRLHRDYPGLMVRFLYDPFQMAVIADMLAEAGVQVEEFTQLGRRTQADTNFRDLIVGKRLAHHGDKVLRRHVINAVAKETSRGLRIAKEKTTLKIDAAVAASMAALGAVERVGFNDEVVVVANPFYGETTF